MATRSSLALLPLERADRCVPNEAADVSNAELATPRASRAKVRSSFSQWDAVTERELRFFLEPPEEATLQASQDEALTGRRAQGPPCRLAAVQDCALVSCSPQPILRSSCQQVTSPATPLRAWRARIGEPGRRAYLATTFISLSTVVAIFSCCDVGVATLVSSRDSVYHATISRR
jgi:hypothetical protein